MRLNHVVVKVLEVIGRAFIREARKRASKNLEVYIKRVAEFVKIINLNVKIHLLRGVAERKISAVK